MLSARGHTTIYPESKVIHMISTRPRARIMRACTRETVCAERRKLFGLDAPSRIALPDPDEEAVMA